MQSNGIQTKLIVKQVFEKVSVFAFFLFRENCKQSSFQHPSQSFTFVEINGSKNGIEFLEDTVTYSLIAFLALKGKKTVALTVRTEN